MTASSSRTGGRALRVCASSELPPGARRTVRDGGRAICVLNSRGRYYAVRDRCPHQGAPLAAGTVEGTMLPSPPQRWEYGLEGRVLRCAWHGWAFDLESGRSVFDPERIRVKTYEVTLRDGELYVLV